MGKPSRAVKLNTSAQSAMEYLITYGWAILIIAVVLAALFELGVFSGGQSLPQACIAEAGFICKSPIYTASGITFTFGQTTGRDYYGDWVFVAAEGKALDSNGVPANFLAGAVQIVPSSVLVPGQTVQVDFPASDFQEGDVPTNPTIGTPFAGYIWMGYCLSPCNTPTAYSKVATLTIKSTAGLLGPPTTSTTIISTTSTSTTTSTSSTTTTIACTFNDPVSGYSSNCNVVFTTTESLSGDIFTTGDITINGGVTLTSDGHIFVAGGTFTNSGNLVGGDDTNLPGGLGGGGGGACNTSVPPTPGASATNSYGGSGGSGGGSGCGSGSQDYSAGGGNTIAPGGAPSLSNGNPGSTPSAPVPSNALIQSWHSNGMQNYLAGAAGGGAQRGGFGAGGVNGADGTYGIYIQAQDINAGQINVAGQTIGCDSYNNGGGQGGGAVIVLAYGSAYTPGTYSYNGGIASPSGCASTVGGNGGNGQVVPWQWSTPPLNP